MSESLASPVSCIDMDLVFMGSTTKIMLTSQHPLVRGIVQDAIENLRASILFNNAFPDATVAFAFTRDALLTATESHGHGGGIVRRRLQVDDKYLTKLISLNMGITGLLSVTFMGGSTSFVARFHHLFPTYQGEDGVLYATLYEWCGGEQQTAEFSANAYMDVYLANMNTLKHILNNRERAFHIMMSDIYAQASTTGGTVMTSTLPIANLDLNELE
ncbi:hypothetical protein H4582DRAFT_2062380 [Lactarius indigo]|nr:hypothetical protein H4582DRAFT_2062380 [Lactarius indigo]